MTLMTINYSEINTLPHTEFSYTSCTYQYRNMAQMPYVSHTLSAQSGKFRSTLYARCTTTNDHHSNSPLRHDHSATN